MKLAAFMNRSASILFLLTAIAIALPGVVSADAIGIVGDFEDCFVLDQTPGLHTLTIVHRFNTGSIASRFKLEASAGMTMTYVSETHAWPSTVGNMRDGMSVCYGSCQVGGDTVLGTITYQGYGTSNSCAELIVKPHPDAETLDVVTCGNEPELVTTFHFEVREDLFGCGSCNLHDPGISFGGDPQLFGCAPVPARSSTWGAIKAMYQ
jgi:hypothetical protein